MNASASTVVAALNLRYLLDYPGEAARRLELMSAAEVAALLATQPPHAVVPVWDKLASDVEQAVIELLPDDMVRHLLTELEPALAAGLLVRLEPEQRQHCLTLLDPQIVAELSKLMDYPPDSAGQLMDPRIVTLRSEFSVHEALTRLRALKRRDVHEIFLVDNAGQLEGRVQIQDLAMAQPEVPLDQLRRKISAVVTDIAPREEVVELLERSDITDLPVVDFSGRLIGVSRQSALVSAVQEEASLDIQTMVGASKDERALSKAGFAVRKRLPWLQINLLTAFLAASVVGLFEGTIAKFTASGYGPIRQCRRAGAGGDHARTGAARNQPSPLAQSRVQGNQCGLSQRPRHRRHYCARRLLLEPLHRTGAHHFRRDGDLHGCSRFRWRVGAHHTEPLRSGPGAVLVHHSDDRHRHRRFFLVPRHRNTAFRNAAANRGLNICCPASLLQVRQPFETEKRQQRQLVTLPTAGRSWLESGLVQSLLTTQARL